MVIKAADMLIARRADTRARADFATWKMMAKLNGASALPPQAQTFLESYQALLKQMPEPEATEATIKLMYQAYYAEMGGAGAPPELPANSTYQARNTSQAKDNVTAFKRPPAPRKSAGPKAMSGPDAKPRLPVALIFACLVVVYVGIRYYLR
jgi:hypothetical protein